MKTSIASLKERLSDWKDWDVAEYELGACLGFWPEFGAPPEYDSWHGTKGIMWSNNPIGNTLICFLERLVTAGILEQREELDIQFRWNPDFKGDWEL